ncbi:MAG: hypothetical protein IJC84_02805 [Clostridia bacterium]|nr:hypothetical protein [Clostridia bacterium]
MKLRYKITGLVLSIAMLLSVFTPLTVSAEEPEKAPVTEEEPRELTLEDLLAGAATVEEVYGELERETVPEIVGYEAAKKAMHVRRLYADEGENLNKVVFLNADLTKTVYLFDHPVKFVDEKGMIQDITLKIKEDLSSNTLMTAKASAVTSFSKNSVDGISLRESGVSLSLVPILPEKSASSMSRSNTRARLVDQKKVVYSYDTKTELEYALTYTGFKEEIVVKEYTGQTRYDFTLHTNGLKVVEKNGSFSLADSAGKIRALLGDIIIFTADEKNNTMGEMTATPVVENQEYLISIFVDAAFLSDPKTAYPIRIDPTVEICYNNNGAGAIQDITLNSLQGSDGSSGSLFVGKRDTYGISRFLMKFPGLNFSSLGDNVTITQATVYIRDLLPDNNAMPLNCHVFTGYVWYENTASWSNVSPNSYLASPVSSHTISSYMGQQQAEWYYFGFDITSVVAGWKSGAYVQEKGLIFKAADSVENGSTLVHKTFGSYNRSSYKPSLTVTYSSGSNLISDGTYYLNNTYSGKYLRYAPGLGLSGQSGLIADLGDTIRWEMIAVEEGNKYAIRSKSDPTKYLCVPETTSSSSVNVLTVSNYTLPSRCLWYATGSGVGGVLLRSVYNSRYLSHNGSALSTSASAGASGTDLIRQTSWRVASTSYYGNTSANTKRELVAPFYASDLVVDVCEIKTLDINKIYTNILWAEPIDYIISVDNSNLAQPTSNNSIVGKNRGSGYITLEHKVTGLISNANNTINVSSSFENTMQKFSELYGLAFSYADSTREAALLALQFVRRIRYGNGNWPTVAGSIDWAFVDYVENSNEALYQYFTIGDASGEEYYYEDPSEKGEVDFAHLCATLNGLIYDSTGFLAFFAGEENVDNLCGWAGDLQTLCKEVLDATDSSNDYNTIYNSMYQIMGDPNYSFSVADLLADTDAQNIYEMLNSNVSNLINSVNSYYAYNSDNRYSLFTDGRNWNEIYACVRKYTTDTFLLFIDWPLLSGYNVTATQSDAMAEAFTDYIWEEIQNEQ